MTFIFYSVVGLVLLFGFVVLFGAPYLPTLKGQTTDALDLIDLKPGQTLLELGCGDGRVLRAAAERGLHVIGYELNPILVIVSWLYTLRYRKQVKIVWGNYWGASWPKTDGIFVFLLDKYMHKLDNKIIQEMQSWRLAASSASRRIPGNTSKLTSLNNVKLVSYAFKIPGKKVAKERGGLYLYEFGK